MAVYLLRHAETEDNAARIVQLPQAPLSARGRAQAERLARRLADAGIVRIRTSDLTRAAETAAALAATTGVRVEVDPALAERDYGAVRGRPYATLTEDIFAPAYEPPGGETWAAFHRRVDAVWAATLRLAAGTPGHLAVVTHGLVCEAVRRRHLDGRVDVDVRWGNTAVTIVEPPRTVRLLACTAHLGSTADGGRV